MRLAVRLKLRFYPLSVKEAARIRVRLEYATNFPQSIPVSELDWLLEGTGAYRHGIEIDADHAEQAAALRIQGFRCINWRILFPRSSECPGSQGS